VGLNAFALSGLLIVITCAILTIIIIRDAHTHLHRVWGFFNISIAIWGMGVFLVGTSTSAEYALTWWKIAYSGVIFIPVLFYHTVWLFCDIKDKRFLYFAYSQGGFFLIALYTNTIFSGVQWKFNSIHYVRPAIFSYPMTAIWIFYVGYGHYLLYRTYHRVKGIKKVQIKYILFGFIAGFIGGLTNFFPLYGIDIYPFGNFFIPFYPVIVTYAIFRYRLLDLNIVIARFSVFILLFLVSVGIPLSLFIIKGEYLIKILGLLWFLVIVISSSSLVATILNFVYLYIQDKAESKLLMNQRLQHQTLLQLSRNMTLIKDLNELSQIIVNSIVDSAKIDYCAVYLSTNNKPYSLIRQKPNKLNSECSVSSESPLIKRFIDLKHILVKEELEIKGDSLMLIPIMNQLSASVITPTFIKDNLLGFIVIGAKQTGQPYTEDDLNIFSTLSNHAALAIENAQFFQELEKTQTELFQAAKMSSLGTLASGMGHQINNRLQAISSLVEFVKIFHADRLDENARTCLIKAIENIEQGKNIIQSLREHARPSAEGYTSLSIKYIFDKAIEMVKIKKGSKFDFVNIKMDITENSPLVIGNKSQLQEVFFNLLDNADDAIQEAYNELYKNNDYSPEINLVAEEASEDTQYVDVIVKDNGIGMNKEQLDKLFIPFHTTKATSQKGTGLGLYVIDRIIKGHGGKIKVTSHYGSGTIFIIQLKKG
jgi:C4-dicarboxylate-specific signal transduction histidine kinase